jgi:hypothetical protein
MARTIEREDLDLNSGQGPHLTGFPNSSARVSKVFEIFLRFLWAKTATRRIASFLSVRGSIYL